MRLCTDEETKAQRDRVTYQISHTAQATRPGDHLPLQKTSQGPNSMAGRYQFIPNVR